jgi:hypothetical protein
VTYSYDPGVMSPQATLGVVCGVILGLTGLTLICYFIKDRMSARQAPPPKKEEKKKNHQS